MLAPRAAAALALALALPGSGFAQEVVAVLSSDMGPYQEAYAGFQEAFGKAAPQMPLGGSPPKEAKVVVAFGGKAAGQKYPGRVTLIYLIAPGTTIHADSHDGVNSKIGMVPAASVLLERLTELQPGLKRLAVFWISEAMAPVLKALEKAGRARSIEVLSERLENAEALPDRLRSLKGKADSIWLPPDPLLINPQSFDVLRQYSYSNEIPLFAPTEGLVERGAPAGVWVSYREIGRTAAAAAKSALAGGSLAADVYPDRGSTGVNRTGAKAAAMALPAEAVKSADKVFP